MPYEAIALVLAVVLYGEHLAALKALTFQGLATQHCDPLYQLRCDLYNEGRRATSPSILNMTESSFYESGRHAGVSPHVGSDHRVGWAANLVTGQSKCGLRRVAISFLTS
jgi:hypothetical protein